MLKATIIFLLCLPIFGSVTQIHDLELVSLTKTSTAGNVRVEWTAEPGNGARYSSDFFVVRHSTTKDFIDAPVSKVPAWDGYFDLHTEHTLKGLGNGTWFVQVGFAFGGTTMHDIIEGGGTDGGWSDYGTIEIEMSYTNPALILPTEQPYHGSDLILRWTPGGPNIERLFLEYSIRGDFLDVATISLLPSDNGTAKLDLTAIKSRIITFRLQAKTNSNTLTAWTFATFEFEILKDYTYVLPWVVSNENGRTLVNINILNDATTTDVQVGILPKKTGTFQPSIWWQEVTAYAATIFLEDVGDLFPFDTGGRLMVFKSTNPISVNIYYDVFLGSDIAVQTPFLLQEGSSQEWLIPSIRKDAEHAPAVVVCNADPDAFAVFDWRVDYLQNGVYDYKTGGLSVAPFENAVIDMDVSGEWVGYVTIWSHTLAPVSVLYSNRNELGDGLTIFGFQPALQK